MNSDRNNMNIKGIRSLNGDVELENMTNPMDASIMDISELANGTHEPNNASTNDVNNDLTPSMDTHSLLREVKSVGSQSRRDRHPMSLDDVKHDQAISATSTCMDVSDNQTFSTIDQSLLTCSARDRRASVDSTCSTFVAETLTYHSSTTKSFHTSQNSNTCLEIPVKDVAKGMASACSTFVAETLTSSNSGGSYHCSTIKSFRTSQNSNTCLESPMKQLARSMDFHIATMASSRSTETAVASVSIRLVLIHPIRRPVALAHPYRAQ